MDEPDTLPVLVFDGDIADAEFLKSYLEASSIESRARRARARGGVPS